MAACASVYRLESSDSVAKAYLRRASSGSGCMVSGRVDPRGRDENRSSTTGSMRSVDQNRDDGFMTSISSGDGCENRSEVGCNAKIRCTGESQTPSVEREGCCVPRGFGKGM